VLENSLEPNAAKHCGIDGSGGDGGDDDDDDDDDDDSVSLFELTWCYLYCFSF
jgi:hypothetical protein